MKKIINIILVSLVIFLLSACSQQDKETTPDSGAAPETETPPETTTDMETQSEKSLIMTIAGTEVAVQWENNESVDALKEYVKDRPLTIEMSMYGGFEQVGELGTDLPRDDTQINTEPGDIVLYSGDQIVVFYGSNSWGYTRLGHITDLSEEELAELLGEHDVTITLEMR